MLWDEAVSAHRPREGSILLARVGEGVVHSARVGWDSLPSGRPETSGYGRNRKNKNKKERGGKWEGRKGCCFVHLPAHCAFLGCNFDDFIAKSANVVPSSLSLFLRGILVLT